MPARWGWPAGSPWARATTASCAWQPGKPSSSTLGGPPNWALAGGFLVLPCWEGWLSGELSTDPGLFSLMVEERRGEDR